MDYAFDSIRLEELFQILYKRHVSKNLINVIEDIYRRNYVKLKLDGRIYVDAKGIGQVIRYVYY